MLAEHWPVERWSRLCFALSPTCRPMKGKQLFPDWVLTDMEM